MDKFEARSKIFPVSSCSHCPHKRVSREGGGKIILTGNAHGGAHVQQWACAHPVIVTGHGGPMRMLGEPEPGKVLTICPLGDDPQSVWVPCEAEMPPEGATALVTFRDGTSGVAIWADQAWDVVIAESDEAAASGVIAWTVFPQPYRGEMKAEAMGGVQ